MVSETPRESGDYTLLLLTCRRLDLEDVLTEGSSGAPMPSTSIRGGLRSREHRVRHLSLLTPKLLDPDSVTGLELNGQWYEFPAA